MHCENKENKNKFVDASQTPSALELAPKWNASPVMTFGELAAIAWENMAHLASAAASWNKQRLRLSAPKKSTDLRKLTWPKLIQWLWAISLWSIKCHLPINVKLVALISWWEGTYGDSSLSMNRILFEFSWNNVLLLFKKKNNKDDLVFAFENFPAFLLQVELINAVCWSFKAYVHIWW